MYTIKQLPEFAQWLLGLEDGMTHRRLARRLYYIQRGPVLIVMLGGGDKATQAADVAKAIKLAAKFEE